MENSFILDSNVIVSFFDQNDTKHQEAVTVMDSIAGHKNSNIFMAKVSLYEVIFSLSKIGYSSGEIKDIFFYIGAKYKIVDLSEVACFRHLDGLFGTNEKISREILRTNDFIISSIAIDFNAKLVTFDEKMKQKIRKVHPNLIFEI